MLIPATRMMGHAHDRRAAVAACIISPPLEPVYGLGSPHAYRKELPPSISYCVTHYFRAPSPDHISVTLLGYISLSAGQDHLAPSTFWLMKSEITMICTCFAARKSVCLCVSQRRRGRYWTVLLCNNSVSMPQLTSLPSQCHPSDTCQIVPNHPVL